MEGDVETDNYPSLQYSPRSKPLLVFREGQGWVLKDDQKDGIINKFHERRTGSGLAPYKSDNF